MKKLLFISIMMLTLGACSHAGDDTDTGDMETPSSLDQTAAPEQGEEVAVITTKFGDITLRLFPEQAPKAVENFTTHAKNGYYDGVIFHRVIPDFMVQGGDPDGTGRGGESIWGTEFEDEFDPNLNNIRGSLAMANRGPTTNSSQFFINQKEGGNLFLDNRHTVFGQIVEGMDVVDQIVAVDRDANDKPKEDIEMTIKIASYGETEEAKEENEEEGEN